VNLPHLTIRGKGQPFVWLHGMLNSVESDSVYSLVDFDKVAEIASVIRYDASGKSVTGDYRWDAMTDQLHRLSEAQKYDSMIIGGTSMGSVTALHFAVKYPEKVKALILVTPPPAWEKRLEVRALYKKIASKVNQNILPEFLKRLISLNQDPPDFFELEHPGTRQRLQECRLGFEPLYYSQIYNGGAASDLPPREQIANIQVPTLIAAIPGDSSHPLDISHELNSLINGSEMLVVSTYKEYLEFQEKIKSFICSISCDNKS
jgi:3-oxoadipate enol-lactonase